MTIFGISAILVGFTSLSMAILLFLKGRSSRTNIIWAFYSLCGSIWGFGSLIATSKTDYDSAFFWFQITYIGIIFLPVLFLHFVCNFLGLYRKKLIIISYILTLLFLLTNLFSRKLFLGDLKVLFNQFYWVNPPGPILNLFILSSIICTVFYSHFILFKALITSKNTLKKTQIKYFIIGSVLGWGPGTLCFLPCYGINLYPYGNFGVILYPIIYTYAIVKYRLMDVRVAVTRAGVFVFVYTIVLGIPFAVIKWGKEWLIDILGSRWWAAPLGLMAVLATVGPFIYIYIQRRAEDALLREQKRYQDTLKNASIGMTRIRDLKRLLNLITHIVTKTVRISHAAIYLYDQQEDVYILQASRSKNIKMVSLIQPDNPLIAWVMVRREPMIYEEIKRHHEDTNEATSAILSEEMKKLNASVVIPSFLEDKFMGLIILGEKNSGQIYTVDDINVFQVLASQAALAIENAQFYEEAKEMQEQIAQAEKMATIGTMADGLSHQINNRFYALSLIAGDTIDTIKTTDVTKCSPEVKEMLDSINHALERIQANVMQGGEVVKGILKYTRKSEEKFEPVSLDQIIDGTLEMVKYKVKLSEIDIIRNYPQDTPKIYGNLIQLQECFFNFIDNAYDSIMDRCAILREMDYRGNVTFSARIMADRLIITIEDNGLGVKEEDKRKIFTPFFTTKTSSHKGTGLGLYVIKRIISDIHKGNITFDSTYAKGTRFNIVLPMEKS